MNKKKTALIAGTAGIYLLLLLLLYHVESGIPDSGFDSFFLTVWYSLVTMTTVGYGDIYPQTVIGKLIGMLFLLVSAGALTALIGCGVAWFSGSGLPRLRIRMSGKENMYIFDGADPAALSLAENILAEDSDALCIFSGDNISLPDKRMIGISMAVSSIVSLAGRRKQQPTVIFTGEHADLRLAQSGLSEHTRVLCQTSHIPDELRQNLRFFDRNDLCASMYWQRFPLKNNEKKVLLIGFGRLGRQLLERALESCVFSPIRTAEYHVFGNADAFLLDHPALSASVSVNAPSDRWDSLFIHSEAWNAAPELLAAADRIIFCSDSQEENAALYLRLKTFFPITGTVHLYCEKLTEDLPAFGTDPEIFTSENVLRSGTERMAQTMHNIYRESTGGTAPEWNALSSFLRRSNLASAEHIRAKLRFLLADDSLTHFSTEQLQTAYHRFLELKRSQPDLCRRIEHDRWVRFHSMYNWNYAPVRNNTLRQHPLMVPFDNLSEAEQVKDDYAWELIETLAERGDI